MPVRDVLVDRMVTSFNPHECGKDEFAILSPFYISSNIYVSISFKIQIKNVLKLHAFR